MKIMNGETLCLDGTTIRASNGQKQSTSVELSRKKLEYASQRFACLLCAGYIIRQRNGARNYRGGDGEPYGGGFT